MLPLPVIASTEDGEIGTAEKEILAFQPFFIEHDPPRVLTEGDEIALPVVLRNYLDKTQVVETLNLSSAAVASDSRIKMWFSCCSMSKAVLK